MNGQSVERLMDVILQMRINLSHITETLHQQTCEIREHLDGVFEERKRALESCLGGIDQKLIECSAFIHEYQRNFTDLAVMREKLVQLGAHPGGLPPALPGETTSDVVAWRLRELRDAGRI
ncbi:MAG TPA: hypothetical protein VH985_20730 [Candidatus Binatia bacterium]|jgi:hypothetical protein